MVSTVAFLSLLAIVAVTASSDSCYSSKTAYLEGVATYADSYSTFNTICIDEGGLDSIKSCASLSSNASYYAWAYDNAASSYMVDFEQLATCADEVVTCVPEVESMHDECYVCDRISLYFINAIAGGDVEFFRDCTDTSRADCDEYDAWQTGQQATSACQQGWNAQCISYRDLVWINFDDSCKLFNDYVNDCDNVDATDYCDTLTGDESFSYDECVDYATQLSYCAEITIATSGEVDFSASLERAKMTVDEVGTALHQKFEDCVNAIEDVDSMVLGETSEVLLQESINFQQFNFLPVIAALCIGTVLGVFGSSYFDGKVKAYIEI